MENSNNNIENKKKRKNLFVLLFAIVFACIIFIGFKAFKPMKETETVIDKYEVLDESVINTDIMKRWIEENSMNKGVYITSDSEFTYALISYGKTTTANIGICLENITFNKNVNIEYSIISTNTEETVEAYTPKMILRFNGTDIKVKHTEINPS